ncbi:GNAT family N-acetyltransferase [Ruegeria sp.]|uniref:GNAT family N-acetyltransferase n=1 Tax=Ruegeria sp. TaxID=1879320 RepID=UPI00230A7A98|nr:GNAT family N-acetyltransferase [Ruegeria sp.]MDA7964499.1 GNAT family N-acetyltransferase [Ruegeria sp.]
MAQMTMRAATGADAEAIRACIAAAYDSARREIPDLPDVTEGIAADIETRSVFVAEGRGQVMGVIIFAAQDDAILINNLAVSPQAQGQGIARHLLEQAESAARAAGLSRLHLRTHRLMQGTRAMYHHLGWAEVDVQGNTVRMEKPVT